VTSSQSNGGDVGRVVIEVPVTTKRIPRGVSRARGGCGHGLARPPVVASPCRAARALSHALAHSVATPARV